MRQLEVTVTNPAGLHARPAANLVQTAMSFQANIMVEKGGRRVSAKSMLSVLSLGVHQGEQVMIHLDGVDEDEALAAINTLAERNFGEPVRKGCGAC